MSSAIISSTHTYTLLPALTSNGIQYGKDAHWLTGRHLTRRTVMNMIREAREPREMRRVIPPRDKLNPWHRWFVRPEIVDRTQTTPGDTSAQILPDRPVIAVA